MNYVNNATTSSTVMVNPLAKAEMGSTTAQAYQRSVGNTKSMIASKYMWIRGQYPNAVSQPCANITSSEHTRNVGVIPVFHEKNQRDGRCVTQPVPVSSSSACRPVINQPSSTHNIMQRLANCNAVGNNQPPTATVGGFSEYMSRILASELIKKGDDTAEMDYLLSGAIPPNPSELLMRPRMKELLERLKERYDIILVDSAPLLLVSDTTALLPLSDLVVYVSRAQYSDKNIFPFIKELQNRPNIPPFGMVLNGLIAGPSSGYKYRYSYRYRYSYSYKYNYGYGYGYGSDA